MTRLVVSLAVIASFVAILSLDSFKNQPIVNQKFDFLKAKKSHQDKLSLLEKLKAPKVKKAQKIIQAPVFKVELNTEGLKRGAKLYSKCIACHGKLGEGKSSQKAPKIGGQYEWFVVTQLKLIQSSKRDNKVMIPYIKNLSAQDFQDLGEYISKLPWLKK